LAELGRKNIARNKFAADLEVKIGDATVPLFENAFDHVMMNPPYHEESRHDVSGHAQKRKANSERDGDLELWIAHAAKALKLGGTLTLIHRADREAEILQLLKRDFGTVEILALLPKVGQAAKRVIVRTHKDAQAGNAFKREFVLHKPDGGFTEEADAILRHAKALLQ
jgi:tRNA1(Val) A37 N6-methylase TrmN6